MALKPSTDSKTMCERGEAFDRGELRNNNPQDGALNDDDANANEIHAEDGRRTGDASTLSTVVTDATTEQDKVVIWGTDSQCDDPELAEFEMLECQELEAFLVEDGEDYVGLAERKGAGDRPAESKSEENRKPTLQAAGQQPSESSETDAFVTCVSTMSSVALDTAGKTQTTESWHVASGPYSTMSEDVTLASQACNTISERGRAPQRTENQKRVDVNLNSTAHSEAQCEDVMDEHRKNNNQRDKAERSEETEAAKIDKSTQADEEPDMNDNPKTGTKGTQSSFESKALQKQGSFDNTLKKQNSFDRSFKKQPSFENSFKKQRSFDNSSKRQGSFENASSLERRPPWGSPSRPSTPVKTTSASPKRQPPGSPARVQGLRAPSLERSSSPQRASGQPGKPPAKAPPNSGIPKPIQPQQPDARRSSPPHKPKNVRPKIITYVRKNPQMKEEAPAHPLRLTSYASPPKGGAPPKAGPTLGSSNLLFDKYRQEMQKSGFYPGGMAGAGLKTPAGGKVEVLQEEGADKYQQEQEGAGVYRSPRALRPQLGLGAVTRQPAAKTRVQQAGQRSAPGGQQDPAGEPRRSGPESSPKSLLLKPGQSGLRPPGFSALPPARLAAFGFVRSSSASSVSSNQSTDSGHGDPGRAPQRLSSSSDDAPPHKATAPSDGQGRPQPPNAPSLQRRSLPPQRCSPLASKRELQKDPEAAAPLKSSPKRFAVVPPKPQSPVRGRVVRANKEQEQDRALIQQLRQRCEQQDLQLQSLQAQLKKASLCLDVFTITTQHFCHKSESAIVKERELSLELARIRDEVAFSVAHWEQLQQEKEELERRFEAELQGLRARQQSELGALEERLKAQHAADTESLRKQLRTELKELQLRQQEQIEEMSENHEVSLMEMETAHNDTLATLQEEHARTVKNLKMAHEQQRKSLEEEFEKIRLSLQDQVDTLTFQNRSLRDRAKRFEEALRKSTDDQIVDALAPYKHIEEDLKSLKDVLEMKNQQIHQQELKISELEKIAEKNVYLEERVQVLQQQNEDLKERIDKNIAVSRHLSEENANLQVHVEKESNEKKRLSRTNEELLWRLQTGELSPHMSPSSSPIHRPLSGPGSGPGSPARPHSYHQ